MEESRAKKERSKLSMSSRLDMAMREAGAGGVGGAWESRAEGGKRERE